jgi:DNA-binding NarL/FixJ family response regulator
MIRVGLVDDQAMVRAGLRMILESEPDITVCGEAADGSHAVALASSTEPDVILMDIRMPGLDGISAARAVLSECPEVRVVILTTFDDDEHVYEALQLGASGFLLKSADGDTLVNAVRVVASGEAMLAPEVTRRVIERFSATASGRVPIPADAVGDLSDRELEVLKLMARGLSNTEIASELFVSGTTVKTHVSHILTKLGVRDRVQAVVEAYESGIVVPGV